MAKRHLRLVTPATVNRTVTPKRLPNSKLRTREYLTEAEVERLMSAARKNRCTTARPTREFVDGAFHSGSRVAQARATIRARPYASAAAAARYNG
jgi:hypothetical protein